MSNADDSDSVTTAARSPLRSEGLLALALLGLGLFLLPMLIYLTGTALLGSYGGGEHLGSFYGDFFRDLGEGSPRAWALVLGPYLLVQLGRLVLVDFRSGPDLPTSPPAAPKPGSSRRAVEQPRERREPTLKL